MLPNTVLSEIGTRNLIEQNDQHIRPEEMGFVARLQQTLPEQLPLETLGNVILQNDSKGRGSTDVSDVSWVTPTTGFAVACWVPGTPGHSWQAVACGAQPLARRGMNLAARTLAITAFELFDTPQRLQAAKAELESRLGDRKYEPLIATDQLPPLDYRK